MRQSMLEIDKSIGARIKARRIELGMSQEELAKRVGYETRGAINKIELGTRDISQSKLLLFAQALYMHPLDILGIETEQKDNQPNDTNIFQYSNIKPIATKKIPMLGRVACGKPIFADEQRDYYIEIGIDINADFVLTASGDSMIGAKINDGDLIFCKSQPTVNNGEIAVVIIGDEATLKRVYYYPEKQKLVLQAENPKYEPFVYVGEELQDIRIIGKALVLQTNIK